MSLSSPTTTAKRGCIGRGDLPPEVKLVDQGLDAYNHRAADLAAVVNFACLARDSESNEVIGGALARRWGSCCELQQIWVDEGKRKTGLGREIMQRIESLAKVPCYRASRRSAVAGGST